MIVIKVGFCKMCALVLHNGDDSKCLQNYLWESLIWTLNLRAQKVLAIKPTNTPTKQAQNYGRRYCVLDRKVNIKKIVMHLGSLSMLWFPKITICDKKK